MSNYIPNKIKVFDDQKQHWMNVESENLMTTKNDVFKGYLLLNRATTSIHIHPASPISIHLYPAHFSLQLALCNTLNVIRTKISHVVGQLP